jgi:hypothetical protein
VDVAADGSRRLLRLLDNFSLHDPGRPHLLVPVEALQDRQQGTTVATGELLQPNLTGPLLPTADAGKSKYCTLQMLHGFF